MIGYNENLKQNGEDMLEQPQVTLAFVEDKNRIIICTSEYLEEYLANQEGDPIPRRIIQNVVRKIFDYFLKERRHSKITFAEFIDKFIEVLGEYGFQLVSEELAFAE